MAKKAQKNNGNTIALNKKAKFDYELHDRFEAGLALTGWEVKSLRAGKGNITDCYVIFKNNELTIRRLFSKIMTPNKSTKCIINDYKKI